MRSGQHHDPAAVPGAPRSALIAGIVGLALLVAPPLATAQDRAQSPVESHGGDKNVTAQVQKGPTIALPSLNPLVQRVAPAVVSISARLNGEAAASADRSADEADRQSTPFDDLLKRFFENRGMPHGGREVTALGSGFIIDP